MSYDPKKPVDLGTLKSALEQTRSSYPSRKDVASSVEAANHLRQKKVESVAAIDLTAADADRYIYLIPKTGSSTGGRYDEYMVVDGALERVGGDADAGAAWTAPVSIVIPAAGWASDGAAGYPCYCDVSAPGVTAAQEARVDIAPSGLALAAASGMCPVSDTMDGKIRLRSVTAPTADLAAEYRIKTGAGEALPIATETQAGVVKPGPGLKVGLDGMISVDTASAAEVQEMLNGVFPDNK